MQFAVKIDYCGLVEATKSGNVAKLQIRSYNKNGSNEKYQPQGENGDFAGTVVFGEDSAPDNSYALIGDVSLSAGAIKLNKIVSIVTGTGQAAVTKKYALENVKISTKAGSPVEITATAQEIEDGATDAYQGVYWLPALDLTTKYEAQYLFGSFTKSGEGCHLIDCSADCACKIGKDDVAGVKVSSDCSEGVITVTGTILSTAGNVPTVTPEDEAVSLGNSLTSTWVLTKQPELTEQNPEKACKQYSFELQLPLKKYRPAPAS